MYEWEWAFLKYGILSNDLLVEPLIVSTVVLNKKWYIEIMLKINIVSENCIKFWGLGKIIKWIF